MRSRATGRRRMAGHAHRIFTDIKDITPSLGRVRAAPCVVERFKNGFAREIRDEHAEALRQAMNGPHGCWHEDSTVTVTVDVEEDPNFFYVEKGQHRVYALKRCTEPPPYFYLILMHKNKLKMQTDIAHEMHTSLSSTPLDKLRMAVHIFCGVARAMTSVQLLDGSSRGSATQQTLNKAQYSKVLREETRAHLEKAKFGPNELKDLCPTRNDPAGMLFAIATSTRHREFALRLLELEGGCGTGPTHNWSIIANRKLWDPTIVPEHLLNRVHDELLASKGSKQVTKEKFFNTINSWREEAKGPTYASMSVILTPSLSGGTGARPHTSGGAPPTINNPAGNQTRLAHSSPTKEPPRGRGETVGARKGATLPVVGQQRAGTGEELSEEDAGGGLLDASGKAETSSPPSQDTPSPQLSDEEGGEVPPRPPKRRRSNSPAEAVGGAAAEGGGGLDAAGAVTAAPGAAQHQHAKVAGDVPPMAVRCKCDEVPFSVPIKLECKHMMCLKYVLDAMATGGVEAPKTMRVECPNCGTGCPIYMCSRRHGGTGR